MLNTGTVVKQVMKFRDVDQKELAEKCGYSNQSCISGLLNRGNLRVDNLFKLINAMDCEIIVKDKKSNQSWLIMDDSDSQN